MLTPSRTRHLLWIAAFALGAAVVFSFWGTINKPDCMDLDFGSYYRAAQAVEQGQSPYFVDEHGPLGTYPYAPAFPFLLIPLGQLDYPWACRLWLLVNWLTLAGCCALALRLVVAESDLAVPKWEMLALALIPMAAYIWAAIRVGQISLVMLLGCLAWAVCRRRGWRFLGGTLLSTACALKLAPAVFVLYLLVRRDFRGLAGVTAGTVLLVLIPALWVGPEGTVRLHGEWVQHTLATQVPAQTFRPGNQSLLGQLARLPAISNGHQCYSESNLQQLCAAYPVVVLILAIIGFGAIRCHRSVSDADWRQETIELALLFTFFTLAQPRGWRCNFVALLLPCLLLVEKVLRRGKHWQLALAALACVLVACAFPTNNLSEDGWKLPVWLLQGKHFWGAAAVGMATAWCFWTSQCHCAKPEASASST